MAGTSRPRRSRSVPKDSTVRQPFSTSDQGRVSPPKNGEAPYLSPCPGAARVKFRYKVTSIPRPPSRRDPSSVLAQIGGGYSIFDGFVKSPSAALRFIFRHCGVRLCTPHSSRFARLASGAFSCAVYRGDYLRSHHFWGLSFPVRVRDRSSRINFRWIRTLVSCKNPG